MLAFEGIHDSSKQEAKKSLSLFLWDFLQKSLQKSEHTKPEPVGDAH